MSPLFGAPPPVPMRYPPRWHRTTDDPTAAEMPVCLCGHDVNDHAEAPELPCLACGCGEYREDDL